MDCRWRKLAIVPAYNEGETIARTVSEIRRWAPDFDVLVVDDGSTDATRRAGRRTPAPACSRLPFNLGIGGAMQAGYVYALEHGYEVAVQVDGDGQHDPRSIDALLERLDAEPHAQHGHRLAVPGARRRAGYRSSAARRVGIRIFARARLAGSPASASPTRPRAFA